MISVTILGAGNVATHLFKAFQKTEEVSVTQWYNRHLKALNPYKKEVEIIDDLSLLKEADVYILAVSDDAIKEISSKLPFEDRLVVHTSG
jgi:pyrroline-5-carboxylate reductase